MGGMVPDMNNIDIDAAFAFCHGWFWGKETGLDYSPRKAEESLDAVGLDSGHGSVSAFCNGAEDGKKNDPFRLRLAISDIVKDRGEQRKEKDGMNIVDLTIAMAESFQLPVEFILNDVFTKDPQSGWYQTPYEDALKAFLVATPPPVEWSSEAGATEPGEPVPNAYNQWCLATTSASTSATDETVSQLQKMAVSL